MDDPAIADTRLFSLRRMGLDVEHVSWLTEARRRLQQAPPDLTLFDPVNPFVMSDRAIKYGVLFIALTFIPWAWP